MENLEQQKKRKSLFKELTISKRNDMIQNSRMQLTIREQKVIYYMLTKVRPEDTPETEYVFSALEFANAIGIKSRAKYNYKQIMQMLQKLANKSWYLVDQSGKEIRLVRWFNTVHVQDKGIGPGIIKIKFHEDMSPYIMNLVKQQKQAIAAGNKLYYTTTSFKYYTLMKSKYSPHLYEILKSYEYNNVEWYFSLDDLKMLLCDCDEDGRPIMPKAWSNFSNFEKSVLKPAQKDINLFTDLVISYKPIKIDSNGYPTKSFSSIRFFFDGKTEIEQHETDKMIQEKKTGNGGSERLNREQDAYEKEKKDFFDERYIAHNYGDEIPERKRINSSRYTLLASEYPEFTEEQLHALYIYAMLHVPDNIEPCSVEIWICDYIAPYYYKIKATSSSTKSELFNRLLWMVNKDIDQIAKSIRPLLF